MAQLSLEDFKVDLGKPIDLKFLIQDLALEYDEKANDAPSIDDKPAKTKPGQVFNLGPHRLMCGDSTKADQFQRLMGKSKADMVFTDPPYNVDYGSNKTHPEWKIRPIKNDKLSRPAWLEFNKAIFSNITAYYKGETSMSGAPRVRGNGSTTPHDRPGIPLVGDDRLEEGPARLVPG